MAYQSERMAYNTVMKVLCGNVENKQRARHEVIFATVQKWFERERLRGQNVNVAASQR